jgi:hypothetical protein
VNGPAGVSAIVLGELAVGGVVLLWLTPLWNEVRRGFFKLTGLIVAVLAASAWGAAAAGLVEGSQAGRWTAWLAAALAGISLVCVLLLFARRERAARVVGLASVPVAVALLIAMAGTSGGSTVVAFLQLAAWALFLGAVLDGLLLGHWYLTDRKLTRTPINRFATMLIAAVVLEAAAVIAGGFGPTTQSSDALNPLLTAAGLAPWIALGMIGTTALIAVLIRAALRGERSSAVQAATGFFYLAVITALTAEFAAKVRFLP